MLIYIWCDYEGSRDLLALRFIGNERGRKRGEKCISARLPNQICGNEGGVVFEIVRLKVDT